MGDEWIKRSKSSITHVLVDGSKEHGTLEVSGAEMSFYLFAKYFYRYSSVKVKIKEGDPISVRVAEANTKRRYITMQSDKNALFTMIM